MKKLIKQVTLKRLNSTQDEIMKRVNNYCKGTKSVYANLVISDDEFSFTIYSNISYEELVNKLVAERYTIQDELAIQRKAYSGLNDEFYIYNAFIEECKVKAKEFIAERESALNDTNR